MTCFLFKILQDDLNKKILDSLLEFVKNCSLNFQSRSNDWASRMRASEIPTAALVLGMCTFLIQYFKSMYSLLKTIIFFPNICFHSLGVNVPDHDMTFQSLSDLLQESVTPFAVSVQAKECAGVLFSLL